MIVEEEEKIGLSQVYFRTYERCVKRFGYRKQIKSSSWEACYDELKIKLPKPELDDQ